MNNPSETGGTAEKGVAAVTGASSGIGMIYADRLAKRGYDLILVARREDRLNTIAQRLRSEHGVSVEIIVADLGSGRDLARVENAVLDNDRVTMLVNGAGTAKFIPFPQIGRDTKQKASLALPDCQVVREESIVGLAAQPSPLLIQKIHGQDQSRMMKPRTIGPRSATIVIATGCTAPAPSLHSLCN
jgi:NAD(P)-dependent dehydrogenase (short-subunit alcohol dehydrogenase family)